MKRSRLSFALAGALFTTRAQVYSLEAEDHPHPTQPRCGGRLRGARPNRPRCRVQRTGEWFQLRRVQTGPGDRQQVQITGGEWVVIGGAQAILHASPPVEHAH